MGQIDCGDRCGWWITPERIVMAVADGLGHGPEAAYAADLALASIGAGLERPFDEIFSACDTRLRDTRGVALAVASIDKSCRTITMASVGNIRVVLLKTNKDCRLGGTRGIVGGGFEHLTPETMALSSGDVLAMFSDGVDEFPALREALVKPATARLADQAQGVLDDWARADDDAAVLLYRHSP
jgi:serine phosphatase RsbU (regulator of sigma subunit)